MSKLFLENKQEDKSVSSPAKTTKVCPQCKTEIPLSAKKCSHCGSDLRSWPNRHPFITVIIILFILGIVLSAIGSSSQPTQQISVPTSSGQNAPTTQQSIPLNNNNPSIKQIGTLPADYVGKSFVLDVNAETANYYNYGFSDDNAYYSIKIWDDSVGGDYDGVYAFIPKNSTNKQLVNALLNAPEKLEVHASIPTAHWQSDSLDNAFLFISSWKMLQ